jgi:hypothetical protein
VTIGYGLTQGTKGVSHALHLTIVGVVAKVALLEDVKPGVELQNAELVIVKELGLEREPRLRSDIK